MAEQSKTAVKTDFMDVVGRPDFLGASSGEQTAVLRILSPGLAKDNRKLEALRQLIVADPDVKAKAYGTVSQPPGFVEQAKGVARRGAPIVGGALGGIGGGALTGGPLGALLGAALGASGAELGAQQVTGEETDLGRAAEEGAWGAAGEAGGRLALAATSKVLAPFLRRAPKGAAEEAFARLEPYAPVAEPGALGPIGPRGIAGAQGMRELPMRPAQASESRAIDIMQNIAEGSIFGGKRLQKMAEEIEPQVLLDAVDDLVESAGPQMDADQLAAAVISAQEGRLGARNVLIQPLYNSLDDATGIVTTQVPVEKTVTVRDRFGNLVKQNVTEMVEREVSPVNANVIALKKFAEPLARQARRLQKIGSAGVGDDEIIRVADLTDEVPFSDVAELRSRLLTTQRTLETQPGANKKAIGRLKRLISLTDEAAETALEEQAPGLLGTFRSANEMVKQREKELNNRFIRGLIRQANPDMVGVAGGGKPEVIVNTVFASPTRARAILTMLGDGNATKGMATPEWKALQRGFVTRLLAPDPATGQFSGKVMKAALAKAQKAGVLDVLDPRLKRDMVSLADAAMRQQSKQASGIGKLAVQFGQATALTGGGAAILFDKERLKNPAVVGPMAVTLLSPIVLGRMLTNPLTARLLIKGARTSTFQKGMAGVTGQLSQAAARAYSELGMEPPTNDPGSVLTPGSF